MDKINISILKDFSRTPGPRYIKEGPNSGELFRQVVFAPAFKKAISKNTKIIVNLDGTAGYGTSFLEEAFGGLIRIEGLEYKKIIELLEIVSKEEDYLVEDIYEYLKDANENKN